MKNPQCQALCVITQTTPVIAPRVELSKSLLKRIARAFASFGSFSSNWSGLYSNFKSDGKTKNIYHVEY
jgi:hypothetical protein